MTDNNRNRASHPLMRCWAGALLLSAAVFAATPQTVREIEATVEAEMARNKIPGVSVAIGENAQVTWSRGFGSADLEHDVPVRPATLFRIASISKPITAVAVMQLVEQGKIDLDAPIERYVPAFPQKPWPVTVRALLSHLGGVRHYNSDAEVLSTRHYENVVDPLAIFAGDPLLCEPGTEFHYSTYGFNLLGAAVEAASGMTFSNYLARNVFLPARMERTGVDDAVAILKHRARGYRLTPDGVIENCAMFDASNKVPGGGLVSTAADLAGFAGALQGGKLVSAESRARMFEMASTRGGKATDYGLGWHVLDINGVRWVAHGGGQPGVSTYLLVSPSNGFSVAVLTNLENVHLDPIAAAIAAIAAPKPN